MENNPNDAFGTGTGPRSRENLPADGFGAAGAANTPRFDQQTGSAGSEPQGMQGSSSDESRADQAKEILEEGRERVSERMDGMRNRVEAQLDEGMRTAADRMEGIAQKLDEVADSKMSGTGRKARAGDVAHTVADRIESTAGYIREQDAHTLLTRLEDQVRERPLEMVLASVATGWLLGKILR